MIQQQPFKLNCWDFLMNLLSLAFFLTDVVLDVLAVVDFYREEDYVALGLLVFLLVGSSVLGQIYSWLWYSYDGFQTQTKVEGCLNRLSLRIVHYCQMGIYLRFAGVVELSTLTFCTKNAASEGHAVSQSHDLNMLRLIETFSESAPQVVLMMTVIIHRGKLEPITIFKTAASVSAIACSVTMYHRSLRSFLPDKAKQSWTSSFVYFLWNQLLIGTRLAALSLFATVLPCYFPAHFLSSWMILFFCAWRSETTFMDSPAGEWLFKGTVALIWYFSWFNAEGGRSRSRCLQYYCFITLDICLLCGLWYWRITEEPPYFEYPLPPYVMLLGIGTLYASGNMLRLVYYRYCHPNVTELSVEPSSPCLMPLAFIQDEVDFRMGPSLDSPSEPVKVNKRMTKLAANFYSL